MKSEGLLELGPVACPGRLGSGGKTFGHVSREKMRTGDEILVSLVYCDNNHCTKVVAYGMNSALHPMQSVMLR